VISARYLPEGTRRIAKSRFEPNSAEQAATFDVVVLLEEDLTQPAFADRVVFEVEFVEPMERFVCL